MSSSRPTHAADLPALRSYAAALTYHEDAFTGCVAEMPHRFDARRHAGKPAPTAALTPTLAPTHLGEARTSAL